ncbi:MAG: hypothetical protein RIT03_1910 [Bacteroidota bacterium]|jgi:four helix bundle protein
MNPQQLEDRLIQFSVNVILLCKGIDNSYAAQHLANQLIRSATSAALNYGEARGGESTNDFLHKIKISVKELRESSVNMKIMKGAALVSTTCLLDEMMKENDELISIFVASIKTATSKIRNNK